MKIHVAEGDTVQVGALLAEIATGNGAAPRAPRRRPRSGPPPRQEPADEPTRRPPARSSTSSRPRRRVGHRGHDPRVGSRSATRSTPTRPSSRSPPTRSTWSFPSPPPARSPRSSPRRARRSRSARSSRACRSAPARAAQADAPSADGAAPRPVRRRRRAAHVPRRTPRSPPSPRRVAAAEGVDLSRVTGTGPGGRITKDDVLAATGNGGGARQPLRPRPPRRGASSSRAARRCSPATWTRAARSRPRPRSARSPSRRWTAAASSSRRPAQKVSFTHLIAYAIALAATAGHAGHGPPLRRARRQAAPHRRRRGQPRHRRRRREEGRQPHADGPGHPRRRPHDLHRASRPRSTSSSPRRATNKLTADDLTGANISLTNPGGIGTIASVPRLMTGQGTIVATGSIAYPVGLGEHRRDDRRREGHDDDLDLRPPRSSRARSRAGSCSASRSYLQGEHGFYEGVFASLGVELGAAAGAARRPPPPRRPPRAARRRPRRARRGRRGAAAGRPGGDLAASRPTARTATSPRELDPLGTEPEGDPALDPEPLGLTPELMAPDPGEDPAHVRPGRDAGRRAAAPARDLLRHDRLRDRAHRHRTASACWLREKIESGDVPQAADDRRAEVAARPPDQGRRVRALHAQGLPRPEAVLDRGPRHDRPDARRADPARRRRTARARSSSAWPTAAGSTCSPTTSAAPTTRSSPSSRAPRRSRRSRRSRRAAPATSSTTTARRAPTSCPTATSILVNLESQPVAPRVRRTRSSSAPRAPRRRRARARTPTATPTPRVPIVLHGDAAFPGQGVVAETLNLQALDGYKVGGTIHLIQNNQVGFTTDPDDARSTRWASDLAKGFDVPIIHVNADDVAACISAVRLAFAFRQEFGHDVVIDLIGYRRFGHNEADEPAYTQPEMYAKIKQAPARHRPLRRAPRRAGRRHARTRSRSARPTIWDELTDAAPGAQGRRSRPPRTPAPSSSRPASTSSTARPRPRSRPPSPPSRLRALNDELLRVPEGFTVHPKLVKQLERRREALGAEGGIDWAHAESLAFASLLTEGMPVRLTGQDVERGTFSPAPPGPARREDRPERLPDPEPAGRARAVRAAQLAAERDRRAWASSTATRRRRPRRSCCGRRSSATSSTARRSSSTSSSSRGLAKWGQTLAPDAAAAARLRGLGPRALLGAPRALPAARRRGQHPRREPHDAGAVLPPAAPPGADRQAAPADHHDAEVAAAPAAGDQPHRAPLRHAVLPRARRAARARSRRSRASCSAPARSTTTSSATPTREGNEGVAIGRVELLYPFPQAQILELVDTYPNLRRSCGSRRSRATWAPARTCSPRLMQILPEHLRFGYIGRPERARRPGLPGRAHRRAEPHPATALDLSRPISVTRRRRPGDR